VYNHTITPLKELKLDLVINLHFFRRRIWGRWEQWV